MSTERIIELIEKEKRLASALDVIKAMYPCILAGYRVQFYAQHLTPDERSDLVNLLMLGCQARLEQEHKVLKDKLAAVNELLQGINHG